MYVVLANRSRCLSGCGLFTSTRRLGINWAGVTDFIKTTAVPVTQTTTELVRASKSGSGQQPAGSQILEGVPNSTLAIGGVAGAALLMALMR